MSPLARPLFALVCVASLVVASAIIPPAAGPGNLKVVYPGECSAVLRGATTEVTVYQKKVDLLHGVHRVNITDSCKEQDQSLVLVGEKVTACSVLVAPVITMGPWPKHTPAFVSSEEGSTRPIQVYVEQYCQV